MLTVNRVPCSSLPRVDAVEHVAQPCARFRAVGELHEDVAPVPHEDGRDDVVLNVVKVVLQVSGVRLRVEVRVLMIALLPRADPSRRPSSRPTARGRR